MMIDRRILQINGHLSPYLFAFQTAAVMFFRKSGNMGGIDR